MPLLGLGLSFRGGLGLRLRGNLGLNLGSGFRLNRGLGLGLGLGSSLRLGSGGMLASLLLDGSLHGDQGFFDELLGGLLAQDALAHR